MRLRHGALVLAAAAALVLGACQRSGSPGGSSSQTGAPATGATGTGATSTSSMGGPGTGLAGGLAPSGSASQPTGVAEGSSNLTRRGSVGNR